MATREEFACARFQKDIKKNVERYPLQRRELWSDPFDTPLRLSKIIGKLHQKHLRCTIVGPDSSYSPFEIHICWKVDKDERIDPPIQTEYFRSGGATTLIFMVEGASAVSSLVMRSPIPVNMVVPPDRTTFESH